MPRFVLFAILTLLSGKLYAQEKQYNACVIAFYNLENFYDTVDNPIVNDDDFTPHGVKQYNTAIYRDKLNKLATVVSQIGIEQSASGPALLGVAEIENDTVLKDLVRHPLLAGRHYRIIHFDSRDARGVDVGLLFDPQLFRPEKAAKLYVQLPGNSKEAYQTRDILYVKGWLAGETIHVYVNHWPSRRGGEERSSPAREAAAKVCRRHFDSIFHQTPRAKIIIMGDLNDDPDCPSITNALGAGMFMEKVLPGGLFNPWAALYAKGMGTLANRDCWGLFDQIIVSHAWLDRSQRGWFYHRPFVFNREFMRENTGRYKGYPMRTWDGNSYRGGYSDHFPTYIVLLRSTDGKI